MISIFLFNVVYSLLLAIGSLVGITKALPIKHEINLESCPAPRRPAECALSCFEIVRCFWEDTLCYSCALSDLYRLPSLELLRALQHEGSALHQVVDDHDMPGEVCVYCVDLLMFAFAKTDRTDNTKQVVHDVPGKVWKARYFYYYYYYYY